MWLSNRDWDHIIYTNLSLSINQFLSSIFWFFLIIMIRMMIFALHFFSLLCNIIIMPLTILPITNMASPHTLDFYFFLGRVTFIQNLHNKDKKWSAIGKEGSIKIIYLLLFFFHYFFWWRLGVGCRKFYVQRGKVKRQKKIFMCQADK